ncbi:MAG TPA: glycosyltransferase family 4 protein [Bryobacteraceae bacterium]
MSSSLLNTNQAQPPAAVLPATPKEQPAVCIIVENLPVPLDRRVWREASALRDAGYRVSVICPKGKGRCESSYESLGGIEIHRHKSWDSSGAAGYIIEYFLAFICELFLALKVFARTRFRVLQACNPPDNIFLIALLLKPFGVRFIFDHHDLTPELFESRFGKRLRFFYRSIRVLERLTFKTANACIATNESFREIAISRGQKRPEEVFIVRNCPELAILDPLLTSKMRLPVPFVVVYVGFMGSQDGLPILIDAIEHIVEKEKRKDVHFVLVGGGTELPALQASAASRGLQEFITFTGQIPYQQVPTYISAAHVGVAPDPKTPMNDQSTMIKILEYMAFGIPTVLFDLKEGRRIAGAAALYASPSDPVDFARKILQLLDNETLRRELGANGRRRIRDGLNWEAETPALLAAYRHALG